MILLNEHKKTILASRCYSANSFFSRLKGLMGEKSLPEGTGLIITPCNSIHMFFMKFPLDAVFIDKNSRVIHIIENLRPWKVSRLIVKARSVIELPQGTVSRTGTSLGDVLIFRDE